MKTKKTKKANLEKQRTLFFQIGTILTLLVVLAAFEWNSNTEHTIDYNITAIYDEFGELPPITFPKPDPVKKVIAPTFEIIPDEVEIPDDYLDLFRPEDGIDEPNIPDFTEIEEVVDDIEHLTVEIMPTFLGQEAKYFRNYIAENIKFPAKPLEYGVTGTVYISFVVDKDGSLNKIEVTRGVHKLIDQAVIDVIKKSPKWEPGIQSGRYVKVKFSTSVSFKIDSY